MAKILVIDDDAITREALKDLLSRQGHEVLTAPDGVNGFLAFRNAKPDLVILDRELPLMSGSKVLKKIRTVSVEVPVIVLTGFDDPESATKYLEAGANAFMSKTGGMEPLRVAIKQILGKAAGQAEAAAVPRASEKSILVVDDEAAVRKILTRFLKERGYVVVAVRDGSEALELVRSQRPDIVLLDIDMPGKNGLQTLKELKALYPDLPVVMVTGEEDVEIARQCVKAGASDYIKKPLDLNYLETEVVANILNAS